MSEVNMLTEAVVEVMKAVKRLKKADNNAFAKYRYTSVDDFKDALRPLLSNSGISVRMTETGCELQEGKTDEKGKVALVIKFTFSVTLEHVSGALSEPECITVILPYVGAQTTGQARSYALKEWLKSRFLASSGDSEDADQHDETEEMSKAEARALYVELTEELRLAVHAGKTKMEDWAEHRRASIAVMPKDWRLQLQRQYKEGLATGKASAKAATPNLAFLAEVEETLSRAKDEAEVEQFFDELDVQSALADDEDALGKAFGIKNTRIAALARKMVPA